MSNHPTARRREGDLHEPQAQAAPGVVSDLRFDGIEISEEL